MTISAGREKSMVVNYPRNIDTGTIVDLMLISEERKDVLTEALPAELSVTHEIEYTAGNDEIKNAVGDCLYAPTEPECELCELGHISSDYMQALIESTTSGELTMFVVAYKRYEKTWDSDFMMEEIECYFGKV